MQINPPLGLYVHIPYCKRVCAYCDFHFRVSLHDKTEMLKAICTEMALRAELVPTHSPTTLYFGGGTPSILSPQELAFLLETLHQHYDLSRVGETTIEVNPDDLSRDYLHNLHSLGFNRLSIGIQSFSDNVLKQMNRRHTAQEAYNSVILAQDCGFDNITIDLIYGLPWHELDTWQQTLQTALKLQTPHISAYHLTIESKTILGVRTRRGESFEVPEAQSLAEYDSLCKTLSDNGYQHYEVSNFALPNHQAIHNSNYWNNSDYLGFGPSAHSLLNTVRYYNINQNAAYIKALTDNTSWAETEQLSQSDLYNEYLLTRLRTSEGISFTDHLARFGKEKTDLLRHKLNKYTTSNWFKNTTDTLALTDHGMFVLDRILIDFFC